MNTIAAFSNSDAHVLSCEISEHFDYLRQSRALLREAGCQDWEIPAMSQADEDHLFNYWLGRNGEQAMRMFFGSETDSSGETDVRERIRRDWPNYAANNLWQHRRCVTVYTLPQAAEAATRGATIRNDGYAVLPTADDARVVARMCPVQRVGCCSYPRRGADGAWGFLGLLADGEEAIVARCIAEEHASVARAAKLRETIMHRFGTLSLAGLGFAPFREIKHELGYSRADLCRAMADNAPVADIDEAYRLAEDAINGARYSYATERPSISYRDWVIERYGVSGGH